MLFSRPQGMIFPGKNKVILLCKGGKSAIAQPKQEEALFFPDRYPQVTVERLE